MAVPSLVPNQHSNLRKDTKLENPFIYKTLQNITKYKTNVSKYTGNVFRKYDTISNVLKRAKCECIEKQTY